MNSWSLLLLATALLAAPAEAQDPLAPLPVPAPVEVTEPAIVPPTSPPAGVVAPAPTPAPPIAIPRSWTEVFAAIRRGRWAEAEAGIAVLPRDLMAPVARAELYLAKGSPVVPLERLQALLAEAPELPQAEQIARLAVLRGVTTPPSIVRKRPTVWLGSAPTRYRAKPVAGEPYADQLRLGLDPLIKSDLAVEAEQLFLASAPMLSANARAEAAQRVAWSYYSVGRDMDARRVADYGRAGAGGEWGSQAAWVSALASWRLGDCNAAAGVFRHVGATAAQRELGAAGLYWAARSEQACRRPQAVAPLLRAAAESPESFYGLLARETLGAVTALPADPHSFAAAVRNLPNVRRSVELVRIGEHALAEKMLRHQAQIGQPAEHHGLIEFAKQLDLAGAQHWLAHNGQRGAIADPQDRYPKPRWSPMTGWRIDPALAMAHIKQESSFLTEAVSPAGAVGLMQVRPGTGQDMARSRNIAFSQGSLVDPRANLEYGQSYIEWLRSRDSTRGQLPRVIAAYNAGLTPVGRWLRLYDKGDPLLWIESIPYWETRYYVPAVFRNLWVYQGLTGRDAPTLAELAQHRWPSFPAVTPQSLAMTE